MLHCSAFEILQVRFPGAGFHNAGHADHGKNLDD